MGGVEWSSHGLSKQDVPHPLGNERRFATLEFVVVPRADLDREEKAHPDWETAAQHGFSRGLVPRGLPSVVPVNRAPLPPDAALLAVVNAPILPAWGMCGPRHRSMNSPWR